MPFVVLAAETNIEELDLQPFQALKRSKSLKRTNFVQVQSSFDRQFAPEAVPKAVDHEYDVADLVLLVWHEGKAEHRRCVISMRLETVELERHESCFRVNLPAHCSQSHEAAGMLPGSLVADRDAEFGLPEPWVDEDGATSECVLVDSVPEFGRQAEEWRLALIEQSAGAVSVCANVLALRSVHGISINLLVRFIITDADWDAICLRHIVIS
jgi:hypothetical protein